MWSSQQSSCGFPIPLVVDKSTKESSKNKNTAEEIKCRQKLKIRREKHKKNKLVRRFNIKYLNKKLKDEASSLQHNVPISRFFDQAIPIEPTYLDPDYYPNKYFHPILGKLINFKRITSLTHNFYEKEYEYIIEERKIQKVKKKNHSFAKFDELTIFLKNSQNENAYYQVSFQEDLKNDCYEKVDDIFFQTREYNLLIPTQEEMIIEQKRQKKKRAFLLNQENDIQSDIKSMPYFKIREKFHNEPIASILLSLSHNDLMLDMLGFDFAKLSGNLEGFDTFNCQRTSNWVLFYQAFIRFKMDDQMNQFNISRDLIRLVDIDGDEIFGEMILYKNIVVNDGNQFNDIYFIFKEANQKLKHRKYKR